MKASRYNTFIDDPATGELLLFNTLYGSQSRCLREESAIVRKILADPASHSGGDTALRDNLARQRHLVADNLDELEIVSSRKRAGIADSNRLDVIVMPTLACNFACSYCYETNAPSFMADAVEAGLIRWLDTEMQSCKVLLLSWFGGEPLLAFPRVLSVSQQVAETARRLGVLLVTHVTTNGYLLDASRIRDLVEADVFNYQITLDGPPETHDRLRVLKNGAGTFRRVFDNVVELASADKRVSVSIRVNFNHTNIDSIPRLLEMFPAAVRPRLRVVYEPIFGDASLSATGNIPAAGISASMASHYELARRLGYDVALGESNLGCGKLVYCYAERERQYIVNYNGDVHKCSVSKFRPEERFGFIRDDGELVREQRWNDWMGMDLFERACTECAHLPLCMGGCRRDRVRNCGTGSFCALVPTNASYILKQKAFGTLPEFIRSESWQTASCRAATPEEVQQNKCSKMEVETWK
jgi:uncharacterized protein